MMATSLSAQTDTLKISTSFTTHVIFKTDITYADLSNSSTVAARIVEQNKNILALKARTEFEEATSVSALEANGQMHTFIVLYEPSPKELIIDTRKDDSSRASPSDISGEGVTINRKADAPPLDVALKAEPRLFHIGDRKYGIRALCENIVSYSDITYIILSLKNKSSVSYDISDATFVIESKKKGKRTVMFEKTIFPDGKHGSLSAAPGESSRIAYSFPKMTLSTDQVLKVYLYENSGQRNLCLTLDSKDVNSAESSFK